MENLFEILNGSLNFVGNGARHISAALDATTKVKAIVSNKEPTSDQELRLLIIELTDQILDAKAANISLKEELSKLRDEAIQAQARNEEFERYEMVETPAGSIVLALKKTSEQKEPFHYLCPACQQKGIKSILQGHQFYKTCHSCGTGYEIIDPPLPQSGPLERA